ncbi:MAG: rRNA maturation RNase YbeY [Spirochaetes bacterium]|nr:rRNA maturation RNase YbeY [Spirochaetota bacterium]
MDNITIPFNGIDDSYISEVSVKIMDILELKNCVITVILCNNLEIQKINCNYRFKDYPTDVISFAYREESFPGEDDSDSSEMLGDIFLSLEKALEQSKELAHDLQTEITRLMVHSILHLIGYDHETGSDDEQIMFKKEDEVIEKLI